jgi:hypothetical protein
MGRGSFAVIYYETPGDMRTFKIRRMIEWEKPEKAGGEVPEWRQELTERFSST